MSEQSEEQGPVVEPEVGVSPEDGRIVIDGPVSVEFARQLAQVFPLYIPADDASDRQIFRNAGRQEVVMLVMQAAQAQENERMSREIGLG